MTLGQTARGLFAVTALLLSLVPAVARDFTDATGRTVTIPDDPARVFAAGPPAAVLLYALAPDKMIGWSRAPSDADKAFLTPETAALPELGRLTGRGGTVNLEVLLTHKPDLILDFGTVTDSYRDLARQVQEQTGIPYVLVDGSFANTPAAIRQMADALGVAPRGEELASYAEETLAMVDRVLAQVPDDARPHVYLARGPEGLESAAKGAINAEIIERAGAVNVAEGPANGLITASPEQILTWAPDTIVTIDRTFAQGVAAMPAWAHVPAVEQGRVFVAPGTPFGFIDAPPSVNRLVGLHWLMHRFYPDHAEGDLDAEVARFYGLFYHVTPDEAAIAGLLGD
ncbi:MAG: iron ABC transporter substrate-binding protein [Paracoccus sp. (in: a-proteobacteria)]|nr:iron ABC transporter substrate-binding protein [Paracoccus sp. (in: a-proteobacteria)]